MFHLVSDHTMTTLPENPQSIVERQVFKIRQLYMYMLCMYVYTHNGECNVPYEDKDEGISVCENLHGNISSNLFWIACTLWEIKTCDFNPGFGLYQTKGLKNRRGGTWSMFPHHVVNKPRDLA